jgi:hypothetical protein
MWNTTQDDPRITNMDPVQKVWMYENWLADQIETAELAKNTAYLLASFSNPEAVKQILEGNDHESTEDELNETSQMIREINLKSLSKDKSNRRKRRHTLQEGHING